mmetsp:Transcript_99550/g.281698  ORF Transcript_99550/g.281698 Transcript_99550/m.281698 type:complete len:129 (+) Transcript_99550:73-459(+)
MPVTRYSPKKLFKLTEDEKKRYKEINEQVAAKGKEIDARAAADRMEAAASSAATDPTDDSIDEKDSDFVGIVLFSDVVSGGELEVTTDDVYFEEPRVVAEEEDAVDEEERSLWGDGDNDPAEAQADED